MLCLNIEKEAIKVMSSLLSVTSHLFVYYCETLRDMNDAVFLFEVHDCLKLGNRETYHQSGGSFDFKTNQMCLKGLISYPCTVVWHCNRSQILARNLNKVYSKQVTMEITRVNNEHQATFSFHV